MHSDTSETNSHNYRGLNAEEVENSISALEAINLQHATLEDIEKLLHPLFDGYLSVAVVYAKGTLIYRGRVVTQKPKSFSEIRYPNVEFVTNYGRANVPGHPMFYGSMGRGVPLYEIGAGVGDLVVFTRWVVANDSILLNQIGFTADNAAQSKRRKNLDEFHAFSRQQAAADELNKKVYAFLGSLFSRKVDEQHPELYKLSNAIAHKLLNGGPFDGIFYPTVAMDFDADNVVMHQASVDKKLKCITVELVRIRKVSEENWKIETLDTAVNFSATGEILWTGKQLSQDSPDGKPMHVKVESEWLSRDASQMPIDFVPNVPLQPILSPLHEKFIDSFPEMARVNRDYNYEFHGFHGFPAIINVKAVLLIDLDNIQSSLCYYIPMHLYAGYIIQSIISNYYLDHLKDLKSVPDDFQWNNKIGDPLLNIIDAVFNGRIVIFSESAIELKRLIVDSTLSVEIRFGNT